MFFCPGHGASGWMKSIPHSRSANLSQICYVFFFDPSMVWCKGLMIILHPGSRMLDNVSKHDS